MNDSFPVNGRKVGMEIEKYEDVWTTEGYLLGEALALRYRPSEEVNAKLKLYASYLEVWSVPLGGHCYIPTEFIEPHDGTANKVKLTVDLATVQRETWERAPSFIASPGSLRKVLPMGRKTGVS